MSITLPRAVQESLAILRASRAVSGRAEEVALMEERIRRVVGVFEQVGARLERTHATEGWIVPVPEVLIALRFLSAVSSWRARTKKISDVADLAAMVQALGEDRLDRELLRELAARVYPGAEVELERLLERIARGEAITI
ncbi:MAG: hypothetical protein D6696_13485 [Acidobacteria bacterium]|nr:MAG: hypothetical protein D6696_13485 [Acidobacteriota bacterium]